MRKATLMLKRRYRMEEEEESKKRKLEVDSYGR